MQAGRPMSASEIYESIKRQQLYNFKARDPLAIVRGQLRRYCAGVERRSGPVEKSFAMAADGKFTLLHRSPNGM